MDDKQKDRKRKDGKSGNGSVHSGHRERLREKFLRGGLEILAEHEVLELVLFYAVRQGNVNPLAHRLINTFGSLRGVLEKDPESMANMAGISINTATLISLFLPVARRYEMSKWGCKHKIGNSLDACEFAKNMFIGETDEVLYMICLDASNNVIYPVEIARGTIDKAPIYPRVVLEKAMRHGSASVILVHNHPTGSLMPSRSDIKVTKMVGELLAQVEILLSDHIIVGGVDGEVAALSFAEKKLLNIV